MISYRIIFINSKRRSVSIKSYGWLIISGINTRSIFEFDGITGAVNYVRPVYNFKGFGN